MRVDRAAGIGELTYLLAHILLPATSPGRGEGSARRRRGMADTMDALLAGGREALQEGDWAGARTAFEAALADDETAQALAGLGEALWWLGDIRDALDHRERAYAAFRRQQDPGAAAQVALRLAIDHWANLGNLAASTGWLARARRLVADHDLTPLRGWVLLLEAYGEADPLAGEELARQALAQAAEVGDADLELCALSTVGATLIDQGRVVDGVAYLDEAMAGSLGGEGHRPDTVVFTSCNTIISCNACAEFERAVQWVRAADRFSERFGCPFLYAECRTLYGSVLVATGDWTQAEEELKTAIEVSRMALPGLHTQALACLAELRLAQGHLEEAERLVAGLDDHPSAVATIARTHLVGGRPTAATTILRRSLDAVGEDRLQAVVLRELLGEALIAQGEPEAAREQGAALAALGSRLDCEVAVARGERVQGRALTTAGNSAAAQDHLGVAVTTFTQLGMPYEAGCTRLLLAEALAEGSPEAAVGEAQVAMSTFEALGAARDVDAAAHLLRRLGISATRTTPGGTGSLTSREQEVLGLLGEGLSNPEIAERLYISRKTVEHHVARILSKLGLRNRAEAAAEAVRQHDGQPGT